jgi:hypothetical protein
MQTKLSRQHAVKQQANWKSGLQHAHVDMCRSVTAERQEKGKCGAKVAQSTIIIEYSSSTSPAAEAFAECVQSLA